MGQKADNTPSEAFVVELRGALNHLYDPNYLRQSSLAGLLGVQGRFDTPAALQTLLTRAIETLKPASGAPNRSYTQGLYDILLYRYIQQVNQDEIANQLGISVRHLRRRQNLAIYVLATSLWETHNLEEKMGPGIQNPAAMAGELDWLRRAPGQFSTPVCSALAEVMPLLQPLCESKGLHITVECEQELLAQVHPVGFQQILLSLLSIAVQSSGGAEVRLLAQREDTGINVTIQGTRGSGWTGERESAFQSARQLVQMSRGLLVVSETTRRFRIEALFESVIRLEILVVDDNPEIFNMMERFCAETRFSIAGLTDPHQVIDKALELRPGIIILDIMMPQIDGLRLLHRIKHHPELEKVPVLICSVLPQKDLATSLGAVGFLSKPFQREEFLSALEEAISRSD